MNLIINKRRINLSIITFILYNFVYVFYMLGYLSRTINIISLLLFSLVCLCACIKNKSFIFTKEFKLILFFCIYILLVSLLKQFFYGDYNLSLLSGILYIFLPITDAFLIVNSSTKKEVKTYIYIMFCRMILLFFLQNIKNFSFSNIASINWADSESSVFESSMAHEFFFMVIFFKYLKNNKMALFSTILCLLCFKRLAFLCSIFVFMFYDIFFRRNYVSSRLILMSKIIFILLPFVSLFFVSDIGQNLFYSFFHITLNKFTTGRTYYINLVLNNMNYYNGYGSTHYYLSKIFKDIYVTDIHCDLLRLYLECGLISVCIYINNLFAIINKNKILFFMLLYCLIEMFVSHFIEGMGIWLFFYLFVYLVLYEAEESDNYG